MGASPHSASTSPPGRATSGSRATAPRTSRSTARPRSCCGSSNGPPTRRTAPSSAPGVGPACLPSAELLLPPDLTTLTARRSEADGNDTPPTATPLTEGVRHDADIQRGVDVDWYALTVPAGQNTLELSVAAPPHGRRHARADRPHGHRPCRSNEVRSSSPTVARYAADVEPGATYLVRVDQPPFSTVFTYDTSGSMGQVLRYVSTALRGFAADVPPGRGSRCSSCPSRTRRSWTTGATTDGSSRTRSRVCPAPSARAPRRHR